MLTPSPQRLLKYGSTLFPVLLAVMGLLLVVRWVQSGPTVLVERRVPGLDMVPAEPVVTVVAEPPKKAVPGEPIAGPGQPSTIAAEWPWFRGPDRDAINKETVRLARTWPDAGPKRLWSLPLGDGYAAAAVKAGRVYVLDYDVDQSADTLRCLSLDDGREIWRNSYPVVIANSHGFSRTIPAVVGDCVVTLGPKCQLACWDAATGKSRWLIDLVLEHGATVPSWYAGQCPFIDTTTDRLIVAPGGAALVMAIDYHTGKIIWQSPNPHKWTMTHVSITPMEFAGRRMYVYCGSGGAAGIAADTGELLWDTDQWRIAMAACPSPVAVGEGRIFFCGGYNSGALMLQLKQGEGGITPQKVFKLPAREFSSDQQTPVLWQQHLYGVRQNDQQLVCMDLDGKEVWSSGQEKFGSGPYLIADGLIFVLDSEGTLTVAEATSAAYRRTARRKVIENGSDSWGPMALVAGRLILRDRSRMVCVDVAEH